MFLIIMTDCVADVFCSCQNWSVGQNIQTQIPFSTNTTTLIDSILKANEKGNQNKRGQYRC
jgi:hypothetical protein